MNAFEIGGRKVEVFPSADAGRPVIYLNTHEGAGAAVISELGRLYAPECSLVAVSGLDWDSDMTPWHCAAVFKCGNDFGGCGAGAS